MSLKTSIKALVLKRGSLFYLLWPVPASQRSLLVSCFYDKTCMNLGSRFSEKKHITLGERLSWALALKYLLAWVCRLTQEGNSPAFPIDRDRFACSNFGESSVCLSFSKAVNCFLQERGFDKDQFFLHSKDSRFPNA